LRVGELKKVEREGTRAQKSAQKEGEAAQKNAAVRGPKTT